MQRSGAPQVTVVPDPAPPWLIDAVAAGGGEVVPAERATAAVFARPDDPAALARLVAEHPQLDWVQLPWAGIEPYRDVLDDGRRWTCGKGVYAEPVAEHAIALALAGMRQVVRYARTDRWSGQAGVNLLHAKVTVVGGGGIAESLLRLLGPFKAETTVVRRHPQPMVGATQVVGADGLADALPGADLVVLALPVLAETIGLIGAGELDAMADHAWLVNVARGVHVVTDDLVDALRAGAIGGAGLDVTDPEPLPDGHPLWTLPNCVITPHTANTAEMAVPLLSARVAENVRRYAAGEDLIGPVDPALGY